MISILFKNNNNVKKKIILNMALLNKLRLIFSETFAESIEKKDFYKQVKCYISTR